MIDTIWDYIQEAVLTHDWVADKFATLMNDKIQDMSLDEIKGTVADSILDLWENYDPKQWDYFVSHVFLPRITDGHITNVEFKELVRQSIAIEKSTREKWKAEKMSILETSKQKLDDLLQSIF